MVFTDLAIPVNMPIPKAIHMLCSGVLPLWRRVLALFPSHPLLPRHLHHGRLGENAARRHLRAQGLKFLMANFRTRRGEIDLIFRDHECLIFVEVKTRSSENWLRPAAAVNAKKKLRLTRVAFDYLRRINNPQIKIRFDIVEVLLRDGNVREIRHLPNTFTLTPPYRYG